jgi:hypothetical protein
MTIKTKTTPALFAILILILCSAGCFAFSFENEIIESDLTSFKWCFDNIYSADKPMYKNLLTPYISPNIGCEDANIRVVAEEPVIYNQETCTPIYSKVCHDILVKGDVKNATIDKTVQVCGDEITSTSCVSNPVTIIEQYDLKKTDYLLSDKTRICVYGARKAKTGFQKCDMNFNYNDPINPFSAESEGKLWWNTTWNYKINYTAQAVTTTPHIPFVFFTSNTTIMSICGNPDDIRVVNSTEDGLIPFNISVFNAGSNMTLYINASVLNQQVPFFLYCNASVPQISASVNLVPITLYKNASHMWTMDNKTDSVGSLNTSNMGGSTYSTPGKFGTSINITTPVNDYVNTTKVNDSSFSAFCWANTTGGLLSLRGIMTTQCTGCAPQWHGWTFGFYSTNASFFAWLGTVTSIYTPSTYALNTWYHVGLTYNGTAGKLYVNGNKAGEKVGAITQSSNVRTVWSRFYYDDPASGSMTGLIDECVYFPKELNSTEVSVVYNSAWPYYASPSIISGDLSLSVINTDIAVGIFNRSYNDVNLVLEGQEFQPYANYTYNDNSTSVGNTTGHCLFNGSNVSVEYYTSSTNTTICTAGCDSTNKTWNINADTAIFNMDIIRFRLCKNSSASGDLHYYLSCTGGTSVSQTITAASLPLCNNGYLNYSYSTADCVGGGSSVNLSIWSDGNTLNKGSTIINSIGGIDRFRNENNVEMIYNDTMQLWHSLLEYEYYTHGSTTWMMWCYAGSDVENQTLGTTFVIENRQPRIFIDTVSDWLSGSVLFTDNINMHYPLGGSQMINITGGCEDDDLYNAGVYLNYSNGTNIYSFSFLAVSNIVSASVNFTLGNFSNVTTYLNGSLGYKFQGYCNDSSNNITTLIKSFTATNQKPSSSWLNSSGGLFGFAPSFQYVCTDREGISMTGYVVYNGTTMATNSPIINGSGSPYSTAGFGTGTYTIGIICGDAFANSTNTTITWTYSSVCLPQITGLQNGKRYIGLEHEIVLNCSNGISLSSCYWGTNDYALNEITPCNSTFNVSLENGRNDLVFITTNGGLNMSIDLRVWAKNPDSDVFGFVLFWIFFGLYIFCILMAVKTGLGVLYLISLVPAVFLGLEIVSISWYAGAAAMLLLCLTSILLLVFKNK